MSQGLEADIRKNGVRHYVTPTNAETVFHLKTITLSYFKKMQ